MVIGILGGLVGQCVTTVSLAGKRVELPTKLADLMYRRGALLHKLANGSAPGINLKAFEDIVRHAPIVVR